MKKKLLLACIGILLLFTSTDVSAAEQKTPVSKVYLSVKSSYKAGSTLSGDDFNVEPTAAGYEVTGVDLINDSAEEYWGNYDSPVLRIGVDCEDGYYFSNGSKSSVQIRNYSAEVDLVKRDSDKMHMDIEITLEPLSSRIGNPDNAHWSGLTTAAWKKGYKNETAEVRLYRNGKSAKKITCKGSTCDLSEYMTKPGTYYFKIRGQNNYDNELHSSCWIMSEEIVITEENLSEIKKQAQTAQWVLDGTGWWYRHGDGTFSRSAWEQICGKWYYFNENGYMLSGCTTPDGYQVGADGAWIQ